jgi:hypothetical protein
MNLRKFFAEQKRRSVYKVAVAQLIAKVLVETHPQTASIIAKPCSGEMEF